MFFFWICIFFLSSVSCSCGYVAIAAKEYELRQVYGALFIVSGMVAVLFTVLGLLPNP